jgi:hypothetical protein
MREAILALLLILSLAPSSATAGQADRVTAYALADITPAAAASLQKATALLFGATPGVLTTQIPGGGPVSLIATGVDPSTGAFTFAAQAAAASDLNTLLAELAAGGARRVGGLPLSGVIGGQAVQLVVLGATQGPGGATSLRLLLAFD